MHRHILHDILLTFLYFIVVGDCCTLHYWAQFGMIASFHVCVLKRVFCLYVCDAQQFASVLYEFDFWGSFREYIGRQQQPRWGVHWPKNIYIIDLAYPGTGHGEIHVLDYIQLNNLGDSLYITELCGANSLIPYPI